MFFLQSLCLVGNKTNYQKIKIPSLVAQNLPAMQETRVKSLGQEDSLEKGMAIHSSILA